MDKYTALVKGGKLISVFAESVEDAERQIGIHLRGRPGRLDLYKQWIRTGKVIEKEGGN